MEYNTPSTDKEHLKMLIKEIRKISSKIQDLEEQAQYILRKKLY
tara:strand:+ start:30 stop:161 length:132 start_codon:yes stop_codon:yes gene_type:complete